MSSRQPPKITRSSTQNVALNQRRLALLRYVLSLLPPKNPSAAIKHPSNNGTDIVKNAAVSSPIDHDHIGERRRQELDHDHGALGGAPSSWRRRLGRQIVGFQRRQRRRTGLMKGSEHFFRAVPCATSSQTGTSICTGEYQLEISLFSLLCSLIFISIYKYLVSCDHIINFRP